MPNSETPSLTPDCSSCASLCCVVFAFDRSESFAFDKAAGEVCRNLDDAGRCARFGEREDLGLKGCITYSCYGAGQKVTQDVFGGRTWRDDARLIQPMGDALSVLRRIHENLLLLESAAALPLDTAEQSRLYALQRALTPDSDWTQGTLKDYPLDKVSGDVSAFLKGLRRHVI